MKKVVVLGDLILDKFSYGTINRINPEAPVPILNVNEEEIILGSCYKSAKILENLGEKVYLISAVGDDGYGRLATEELDKKIKNKLIITREKEKTNLKNRFIVKGFFQQLFRVDYGETSYIYEKEEKEILNYIYNIDPDYIIISDYGLGIITYHIIKNLKDKYKLYVHTKPKHIAFYKDVTLIKPVKCDVKDILSGITNYHTSIKKISELFNIKVLLNLDNNSIMYYDKYKIHEEKIKLEKTEEELLGIEDYILATCAYYDNNSSEKKNLLKNVKNKIIDFFQNE